MWPCVLAKGHKVRAGRPEQLVQHLLAVGPAAALGLAVAVGALCARIVPVDVYVKSERPVRISAFLKSCRPQVVYLRVRFHIIRNARI